jgi:hypothetical protein
LGWGVRDDEEVTAFVVQALACDLQSRKNENTCIVADAGVSSFGIYSCAIARSGLDVLRDELGHLEHGHLLLAAEDRLKLRISVDVRALLRILETILLDVVPELLRDLATRSRFVTHNGAESGIHVDGSHERGIWFALRLFLWRGFRFAGFLGCGFLGHGICGWLLVGKRRLWENTQCRQQKNLGEAKNCFLLDCTKRPSMTILWKKESLLLGRP